MLALRPCLALGRRCPCWTPGAGPGSRVLPHQPPQLSLWLEEGQGAPLQTPGLLAALGCLWLPAPTVLAQPILGASFPPPSWPMPSTQQPCCDCRVCLVPVSIFTFQLLPFLSLCGLPTSPSRISTFYRLPLPRAPALLALSKPAPGFPTSTLGLVPFPTAKNAPPALGRKNASSGPSFLLRPALMTGQ